MIWYLYSVLWRRSITRGEEKLEKYYVDDTRKFHRMVDGILSKFGGVYWKDRDDFYSLADEMLAGVYQTYGTTKSFDGYVYSCLGDQIKTEMTRSNQEKQKADRMSMSLEVPVGDEENRAIGDMLMSGFDMKRELASKFWFFCGERMAKHLEKLSGVQRQIVKMKMEDRGALEVKKKLGLLERQYDRHCRGVKSFNSAWILYGKQENRDTGFQKEEKMTEVFSQTSEKSKQKSYSILSIIRKMGSYTFRFDHPVQREAEQQSPEMKGNLISDILQDSPIPALVSTEQIADGMMITWNLGGKQECIGVYGYYHDSFRASRNVRRWLIRCRTVMKDKAGHMKLAGSCPQCEWRECDIHRKKYSELSVELQGRFHDYTFEVIQYLDCNSEDISYHIVRCNEGKPVTQSQKGMAYLGEEFASMVKSISSMDFFKDKGGYKVSEFRNRTINHVVVESVMASNFPEDRKRRQEELCDYIRENAIAEDFEQFEEMVERLSAVVNDDVTKMFDSKGNFLWFGLFAGLCKLGLPDEMFVELTDMFWITLHEKVVDDVTFDDLNGESMKDKSVVLGKMRHLEWLMMGFLEEKR